MAQGFILLFPLGGEQTQSLVGQGAGKREFLRLFKIHFGGVRTTNPQEFIAEAEVILHGCDGPCGQGDGEEMSAFNASSMGSTVPFSGSGGVRLPPPARLSASRW